jgi:alpha 1,2-mannosyltransferase
VRTTNFLWFTLQQSYLYFAVWSNFEIADMDFWRGPAYSAYVDYLISKGGFYYERWGDAPVHTIGAGLFLSRDQIHFFDDIGYEHSDRMHCPTTAEARAKGNCECDPGESFGMRFDSSGD